MLPPCVELRNFQNKAVGYLEIIATASSALLLLIILEVLKNVSVIRPNFS
jgi:hypothetical protein